MPTERLSCTLCVVYETANAKKECLHCAMLGTDTRVKIMVIKLAEFVVDACWFLKFNCRTHKTPRIKFPSGLNLGYIEATTRESTPPWA